MVEESNIKIITPEVTDLVDDANENDNKCTVEGCDKVIRNSSSLRLHMVKAHRIGNLDLKTDGNVKVVYACPVVGCSREKKTKRYFANLYRVKRHYQTIHAEKKFKCRKCKKAFGLHWNLEQHQSTCQQLFYCSCGCYYTTLAAVRTHATRKGKDHHVVEDKNTVNQTKNKTTSNQVNVPAILIVPNNPIISNLSTLQNFNTAQTLILTQPKQQLSNMKNLRKDEDGNIMIIPKPIGMNQFSLVTQNKNKKTLKFVNKEALPFLDQTKAVKEKYQDPAAIEVPLPPKKTKFEEMIAYLKSAETQEILKNKDLIEQVLLTKNFRIPKLTNSIIIKSDLTKKEEEIKKAGDVFEDFNLSAKQIADTCTQTVLCCNSIADTIVNTSQHVNTQTISNPNIYNKDGVLKTSDFGIQCNPVESSLDISVSDNQVQTEDFNFWFNQMEYEGCFSNMETQTNSFNTILNNNNISTQTLLNTPTNSATQTLTNSLLKDNLMLNDYSNISTQTNSNRAWFNEEFLNRHSIETNTEASDLNLFGIDFNVEHRDQASQLSLVNPLNVTNELIPSNNFATQTLSQGSDTNTLSTQTMKFDLDYFLQNQCTSNSLDDDLFVSRITENMESTNKVLADHLQTETNSFATQTNIMESNYTSTLSTQTFSGNNTLNLQNLLELNNMVADFGTQTFDVNHTYSSSTQTFNNRECCSIANEASKSTIETQTFGNKIYSSIDNEAVKSNTETQTFNNRGCCSIENEVIKSNIQTQTFNNNKDHLIDKEALKSNIETQTFVSFLDLLDTSSLDDYIGDERIMNTIETQTLLSIDNIKSSIETQTFL